MDEARLIQKLLLVEALHAGATTTGERLAAELARERILARLRELERQEPPVEYRFTFPDMWSKKVFLALLRRYDLEPYRYAGQRYTTVMVRVTRRFVNEILWPELEEISQELRSYLAEVTDRVIASVLHADTTDAPVVDEARPLLEPAPPPAEAPVNRAPGDPRSTPTTNAKQRRTTKKKRRGGR